MNHGRKIRLRPSPKKTKFLTKNEIERKIGAKLMASSTRRKYVARAEGPYWRIFNRKTGRAWGNWWREYPQEVLDELNGPKRSDVLAKLGKQSVVITQGKK